MTGRTAVFLYAITAQDAPRPPTGFQGLDGACLNLVRTGVLSAIVSHHAPCRLDDILKTEDLEALKALAARYHACLNQLSQTLDLLPVRFGTVLPDAAALENYFETNQAQLAAALSQTHGHLEWTIRLRQTAEDVAESDPLSPKDYLRQRQRAKRSAQAAANKRADLAQAVADQIAKCPARQVVSEPVKEDLAAMHCFANLRALSPRGRDAALLERLSAIVRDEPGISVDVFGPEAPFRFSNFEEHGYGV